MELPLPHDQDTFTSMTAAVVVSKGAMACPHRRWASANPTRQHFQRDGVRWAMSAPAAL